MPSSKPVFVALNTALARLPNLDFQPSAAEERDAKYHPIGKEGPFMREIALGGLSFARRGRRAAREGDKGRAALEYSKATAVMALAVPGTLATWGQAVSIACSSCRQLQRRTSVGLHEHALCTRLATLAGTLKDLTKRTGDGLAAARDAEDLMEAVQLTRSKLEAIEHELKASNSSRLRLSVPIAKHLAAAHASQQRFSAFVAAYTGVLPPGAAVQPGLAQGAALGAARPAPAAAVTPTSSSAAQAATFSLLNSRVDGTITLRTSSGGASNDVHVATRLLGLRSTFFQGLFNSPLATEPSHCVTMTVPDPVLAKQAILAVMSNQLPTLTSKNFLPLYTLFDMWNCASLLHLWRKSMVPHLRKIGMDAAMQFARLHAPGSPLAEELWQQGWSHFIPVTKKHFEQAWQGDPRLAVEGHLFCRGHGETWVRLKKFTRALQADIRWRVIRPQQFMSTDMWTQSGISFGLCLRNINDRFQGIFNLFLVLTEAPMQAARSGRPQTVQRCRGETLHASAFKRLRITGEANGLSFDKTYDLPAILEPDNSMKRTIRLGELGSLGVVDGQQTPLLFENHMALGLRVTVTCLT